MKITANARIQNRNIKVSTQDEFEAKYFNHEIKISYSPFVQPRYPHLRNFLLVVKNKKGDQVVGTNKDFHTIKDAIRETLKMAKLI